MPNNSERLDRFLEAGWMMRALVIGLSVCFVAAIVAGIIFSTEPERFVVTEVASKHAMEHDRHLATGYTTTVTLMHVASTLLDKSGGYLSNDVMPPGLWLDNIPNWEFGVLVQVRDLSRALRKDFSRSQSQSTEDVDLVIAEPQFHFDNLSWALPDTEGEYRRGIDKLNSFALRLADKQQAQAQFFARADNLRQWLKDVETRLGSLSQRLSASVGQKRINVDLAGSNASSQSTESDDEFEVKTPWTEIDDVFYEARGSAWALIHILKAIEVDFADVLHKKNALVSVKQIVRELEATQETVWAPMVLNGSGFGMTANHSLVMASYLSRANAGIIDLRTLLSQG
ncbi:DUF2333 family protein [Pseudomonas sp. HK3]|jgi:hypothetical protein